MPLAWPLQCRCHPGFHLKQDGKTCVDVDECTTTYPCAQHCINTHGSFHCLCVDGFVPRPDDLTSCKSTSGEHSPLVLLCSRLLFLRVKRIQYRMSYKNALLAKMFEVVEKFCFKVYFTIEVCCLHFRWGAFPYLCEPLLSAKTQLGWI